MEHTENEIRALVVICLIVLAYGFAFGDYLGTNFTRAEAVKAGVAKWTVNAENGETKFEWIRGEK